MSGFDWREYLRKKENSTANTKMEEEKKRNSYNNNGEFDWRGYLDKKESASKVRFDTFSDDFNATNSTIKSIYGDWQNKETMANTRSSVEEMYNRLLNYEDYRTTYGDDTFTDLSEFVEAYKTTLDDWGDLESYYGQFDSADAFNTAKKEAEERAKREEEMRSADLGALHAEVIELQGWLTEATKRKEDARKNEDDYIDNTNYIYYNDDKHSKGRAGASLRNTDSYRSYMNKIGYESIEALEAAIDEKNAYLKEATIFQGEQYALNAKDFEKYSKIGANVKNPSYDEAEHDFAIFGHKFGGEEVKNKIKFAKEHLTGYASANAPDAPNSPVPVSYIWANEDEQKVYEYYLGLEIEGKVKKGTSDNYLAMIQPKLEGKHETQILTNLDNFASGGFWSKTAASTLSVAYSLTGAVEHVQDSIEYDKTGVMDDNFYARGSSIIRNRVSQDVDFKIGNWDAFDFAYNTGMSMADSVAAMGMGGHAGGGILALSAAGQGVNDALDRGLSSDQAFWNGFHAGCFEMVFESISIGKFFENSKATKSAFGKLASNMITNLSEEEATEIANIMYDNIHGELSHYNIRVKELVDSGEYTKSEAEIIAKNELRWQVAEAGLSGAVMGGGFTAVGALPNAVNNYSQNKNLGQAIRQNERVGDVFDLASDEKLYNFETEEAVADIDTDSNTEDSSDEELFDSEEAAELFGDSDIAEQASSAYKTYTQYAKKSINANNASDYKVGKLGNKLLNDARTVLESDGATIEQVARAKKVIADLEAFSDNTMSRHGEGRVRELYGDDETVEALINEGLASEEGSDAYNIAKEFRAKLDKGDSLSEKELARLVDANNTAIKNETSVDINKRLKELGEKGDVSKLANAISSKIVGQKLTSAEAEMIENSEFGKQVLTEMSEDLSSDSAENVTTAEVSEKLAELGETAGNVAELSEIISKAAVGEKLSPTEAKTLEGSDYGKKVLAETSPEIAEAVEGMDEADAELFAEVYDGTSDIEYFMESFNLVKDLARANYTDDYILQNSGALSPRQVAQVYSKVVTEQRIAKQRAIDEAVKKYEGKLVRKANIDDSVFNGANGQKLWRNLSSRQKQAITFVKAFAQGAGINLKITYNGKYNGKAYNGYYDNATNTIVIDARAGFDKKYVSEDAIIPTMSHELTHWMKQKSPELYAKLSKQIFDVFKGKGLTEYDLIAQEKQTHPDMSDDAARDEIIARASEDLFKMSEEGKKIFDSLSETEKKTLVEKIKDIIKNLVDWANELLGLYESKSVEAGWLREFKDELSEIAKTWDQMLISAVNANAALEADFKDKEIDRKIKEALLGTWKPGDEGLPPFLANDFLAKNSGEELHLKDGISKDGTTIVGDGVIQMSEKTYNEGGREYLVKWLSRQKGLTKEDKADIVAQTDKVAEIMRAVAEGNELPDYSRWANLEVVKDEKGEKVLSVIVKNGDYTMNIDFSQVCKKRVALNAVLNAMVQAGDLNVHVLTETDVADLNAIIKKHDFEIACALCFVDSKRYRVGAWAESFCEGTDTDDGTHKYGFNEMVRSLVPKGSKINVDEFNFTKRDIKNQPTKNLLSEASDSELDFSLIDKIMSENDVRSAQHRYARAIKENPQIRKILNSAEIISSIGLDAIRLEAPALYNIINGHQGTAKPKFSHDAVAYGNDVLKARSFTAKRAKMVGGVRCQSFSDFQANMIMDYAQFISELAAKRLTSHSYTKEPLFVKLFGMTGMKINMSLVPKAVDMTAEQQKQFAILKDKNADKNSEEYKSALEEYEKLAENAGLDENGNYIWEDETFPYDIAMEIVDDPRYSANCGTIAVGISKAHILKLLADDKISMVIPYHKSGLNRDVAMMRDIALYHDYTSVQNTRYANDEAMYGDDAGKKLNKDKGDRDFDFYGDLYGVGKKEGTHDPKKTAQNYLDWCDKHNYTPRFDEFRDNPNYYKLLVDFRVYDTDGTYREQQAVKAIYPEEAEFKDLILNGVKDKDGKVYGGLLQSQENSDRLKAETSQIVDEYRGVLEEKYGQDVLGVQLSEKEIIGESGTNYGMGVYLDGDRLSGLTDEDERIRIVKEYVKEIGGSIFTAYDSNGNAIDIHIAKASQMFKNKNGAKVPVNRDLTNYLRKEVKQESVILIDKLIANAEYSNSEKARYPHDWLDNYGQNDWDYWKVFIQEKNKTVWEATLNIATSANGEKILYDIYPIKMVEQPITLDTSTTKNSISDSSEKSNEEIVNNDGVQMSEKDTGASAYDIIGEKKALEKRYNKLAADFANYKERVKLDKTLTKGKVIDPKQLEAVARYLVKFADSDYKASELAKILNDLYVDIQDGAMDDSMTSDEMYAKAYEVAKEILSKAKIKIERPALYDKILKDIRSARIAPNDGQKGDAKHRFGEHYVGKFRGRVTIANDGTPLDIKWSEWASKYPSVFDKDIGDAQRLVELYDIYDDLRNAGDVVQEYEKSELLQSLATEIINKAWTVTKFESTADKQNKRIQELNAEHRKAMEELRESYEAKATATNNELELYQKLYGDMWSKRRKAYAKAKELGRKKLARYKENAERNVKIQRITNNALTLNKWLVKNSKDEHIHEALKTPVINLLNAIDFSSKRMLDKGIPTNKDVSLAKALTKVKDMMIKASNGHADFVQLYGHGLDESIEKMMNNIEAMDRTIADNEYILQKMNLEDLTTLDNIVRTVKHSVTMLNKFHIVNHTKGIANLSQESVAEMDSLGKGKSFEGVPGKLNSTLVWNNTIPVYAFKRYGNGGTKVFEAIQDGWDRFAFNVKESIDYANKAYTTKEVTAWEKEVKTFKILVPTTEADIANPNFKPEYQNIQMTIPQIMSLYCLQKREQAKGHMIGGGIRIADFSVNNKIGRSKVVSQADGVVLTAKDIDSIIGTLTNRQRVVADKLQEFMNTVCTDWGNEVSMARFGYKAFGEEDYFPIQSDKNNLAVDDETEKNNSLFRLLNMSFTKSLVEKANNRIVISNIFDVFAQHTSDMAKYNALALPVLDAFRWYNYTEKMDVGDEGAFKTKGVKQAMERALGKDGQSYFTTFLKDINGAQSVSRDTLGDGLLTKAKIASVGANLRVIALQPTSFVRAGAVLNPANMLKASAYVKVNPVSIYSKLKKATEQAEKYCGMALWKSLGYYDTNIQKGVADQIKHAETKMDKVRDFTMKGAELADKATFGTLWIACEFEIKEKRKDLKVGSEEYYTAVGKKLREVIYLTQVVDSTMTRSQMMRSTDRMDKLYTSFMSEPTLAYNMVLDAVSELNLDARKMGKSEAIKKNGTRIARVIAAYTVTNAVAALIESAFDAYRDDEDEEMSFEKYIKIYLSNFKNDMGLIGKIPVIKDVISIFEGYGTSNTAFSGFESLYYAINGWTKVFTTEKKGNPVNALKHSIKAVSYLTGLPFYNVYRDVMAGVDKSEVFTAEDLEEMLNGYFPWREVKEKNK